MNWMHTITMLKPQTMIKEITKVVEAHVIKRIVLFGDHALDIGEIPYNNFPALVLDIEKLVREEAEGFHNWMTKYKWQMHSSNQYYYMQDYPGQWPVPIQNTCPPSELFTLYLNSKNNSN